jgi:mono/diheme cytochrome c family protein
MKIKIHPLFIITAPVVVLVSCAQSGAQADQTDRSPPIEQASDLSATNTTAARTLFLRNCAHCHGADAHGDDGPDLHNIDWTDEEIANRIRKGKSGQMTAFAGKLQPSEINLLVTYVKSLK